MIGIMMTTEDGRKVLASQFPKVGAHGADWLKTHEGQLEFAGNGVAYFPSQGNDPACTGADCDISSICQTMVQGVDVVGNLAKVAAHSPDSRLPARSRASGRLGGCGGKPRTRGNHQTLDYWGWQTCTEFGFYQTCDVGSRCFYTQGINLLSDMDGFCQSDYGISRAEINASIAKTNAHYGADRPDLVHNATRIYYVNGDVDPWSGLSILPPGHTEQLPTLEVSGASHHFWTHPSKPTDAKDIVMARLMIRSQGTYWLSEA